MAFFCDNSSDISDLASKDTQRIVGSIAKALAANAPFMSVIGGGTFPSGTSDAIRSVVQMQAAPGDSLAVPQFICDTEICGQNGIQDLTDVVDFTLRLSRSGVAVRTSASRKVTARSKAATSWPRTA